MVDAEGRRRDHVMCQTRREVHVPFGAPRLGVRRPETPGLAFGEEVIRWRTHGHSPHVEIRGVPDVETTWMNAQGKIEHEPDATARQRVDIASTERRATSCA